MILHNPWLVLHSPSSCGPPHHCLVCARPLSPPNTDVTCTSFRKTVRQAGWEENTASWILSYLMPQCPQQLGEVITGEILSLHSCQECTNRYLQVPSLSLGLATKVNTGQEREGRWVSSPALTSPAALGCTLEGRLHLKRFPDITEESFMFLIPALPKRKGPG